MLHARRRTLHLTAWQPATPPALKCTTGCADMLAVRLFAVQALKETAFANASLATRHAGAVGADNLRVLDALPFFQEDCSGDFFDLTSLYQPPHEFIFVSQ